MGSKKCGEKKKKKEDANPKTFSCKKCGATSNKEKKLCKPQKK